MNGDDIMKENIDLGAAIEKIQNYAINSFHPSYVRADSNPADVAKYSDFAELPHDIIGQVPDVILKVYGEKKGALEWRKIATAIFKLTVVYDASVEVTRLMRALLAVWDEERKFMFKGKDGKDYTSFEDVRSADEFYTQHENPTIENGRSR